MVDILELKKLGNELCILYVEDDLKLQNEVSSYLKKFFGTVHVANDGIEGLNRFNTSTYDLIITDINMPNMDGLEMASKIKKINQNQHLLIVSAATEVEDFSVSISVGVDGYIIKPIEFEQLNKVLYKIVKHITNEKLIHEYQENLEKKVIQRTKEIRHTRLEVIRCLGRASDYRDNETGLHIIRMSHYSRLLAKKLFPNNPNFVNLIYNASPLHDVGKIGIPDAILLKPGKFDDEEWEIMKKHTIYGAEIINKEDSRIMKMSKEIALSHHEKWDGTGYPYGLKEEEIPLSGRIVAVADVFDALTTIRPYKCAWTVDEAVSYINEQSGLHFDPNVVNAFNAVVSDFLNIKDAHEEDIELKDVPLVHY